MKSLFIFLFLLAASLGAQTFDVKDFGAAGDGISDDTVSINAALDAAKQYVADTGQTGTVYLPAGTYGVSIQPNANMGFSDSFVFTINQDNITFMGDGPELSSIIFHTLNTETRLPMADPDEHWTILGDGRGYGKVIRGGLFQAGAVDPSKSIGSAGNAPINVTIKSLTLDGNAKPTGNAAVGGQVLDFIITGDVLTVNGGGSFPAIYNEYTKIVFGSNFGLPPEVQLNKFYYIVNVAGNTFQLSETPNGAPIALTNPDNVAYFRIFNGVGWDMSHKGYALHGGELDNIRFENTRWKNWRGEIIHAGGDQPRNIFFINSIFELADASMISCGGNIVIDGCTLRNGYNGIENYSRQAWHGTTVINSTFENDPALYAHPKFGVVYIGLPAAKLHVENNDFSGWSYGIFLSESAYNVKILNNRFNVPAPMHIVALWMYPNDVQYCGIYNDVLIEGNTFTCYGENPFYLQGPQEMQNFTIRGNDFLVNSEGKSWRFLMRQFVGSDPARWQNFVIEDNYIEAQAGVFPNGNAIRATFRNNTVWPSLANGQGWPYNIYNYWTQEEGAIRYFSTGSPWPVVIRNFYCDSRNDSLYWVMKMEQGPIDNGSFPVGFKFKITSNGSESFIKLLTDGWSNITEPYVLLDPTNLRCFPDTSLLTGVTELEFVMTENGRFSLVGDEPPPVDLFPELNEVPNQLFIENEVINIPLVATGGDVPLSYSLENAPEWLSVDAEGVISGIAGPASSYSFKAVVTDIDGDSDSVAINMEITSADKFPVITSPQSITVLGRYDFVYPIYVDGGDLPLTVDVVSSDSWVLFDSANRVIYGTASNSGKPATASITVTDIDGDMDSIVLNINVEKTTGKVK